MQKKKFETSKLFVALISIFGALTVVAYYGFVFLGYEVDSSVAIAGISEIIVPVLSYLIYQAKLKDSRNKYRVDQNGVPYDLTLQDFEDLSSDENEDIDETTYIEEIEEEDVERDFNIYR